MNEDLSGPIYMSPEEWKSFIERIESAQPLLPKPATETPEPGSPSSSTDPLEVDPDEDLRKYIPHNQKLDLSLPLKQSTYSAS